MTLEKRYMYIGPNILAAGLKKNQVYIGKPNFIELKKQYSLIDNLIIPLTDITVAMEDLDRRGSVKNLAKLQILKGGNK